MMYRISFAGAGNVADSLCRSLFKAGHGIIQVTSRRKQAGERLARTVNAAWSDNLAFSGPEDFIIVSVPDNALQEVLDNVSCKGNAILLHTAGSYGLEVFPGRLDRTGVLYPLQTFTKGRTINLNGVPFLVEASSDEVLEEIKKLAGSLSGRVIVSEAGQRRMLHLAAVFACNFTNHIMALSESLTRETSLPFDILHPLILETIDKALDSGPAASQTGPAVRNDMNTVEKHMKLLSFSPRMKNIYKELSDSIIEFYRKNEQL